jgi:hypothetical protein
MLHAPLLRRRLKEGIFCVIAAALKYNSSFAIFQLYDFAR